MTDTGNLSVTGFIQLYSKAPERVKNMQKCFSKHNISLDHFPEYYPIKDSKYLFGSDKVMDDDQEPHLSSADLQSKLVSYKLCLSIHLNTSVIDYLCKCT